MPGDRGTLLHVFWSCPKLTHFWAQDYKIPGDPAFFLVQVCSISAKLYKKSIVRHFLNAAKSCIPLHWAVLRADVIAPHMTPDVRVFVGF